MCFFRSFSAMTRTMSSFNPVNQKRGVSVDKEKKLLVNVGFLSRPIIGFTLACGLAVLISRASGASALSDAVVTLSSSTDAASRATTVLDADVSDLIAKYRMTNAGDCALLVIGNSSNNSAPIYFIPGPTPAVVLQADLIVGPGITITEIDGGPAATAAGKNVQSAPIPGGERFIVSGTRASIGAGQIGTVNFDLTGAAVGSHIVAITNFVGGDALANDIPMCVTTGVITK